MIYLDNSATTKPYPEAVEAFATVAQKYFGNPSSLHQMGIQAEKLVEQARTNISKLLGLQPGEIVFTSGGTEGNNTSIKGAALQYRTRGKHIITTGVEHASSHEAFKQLEEFGFEVTYLPVDEYGKVSASTLKKAMRDDTILVSIIYVNNEIGSIQPIEEIGAVLKSFPKALFHIDAIQAAGKVPLPLKKAGVDLATFSSHKFNGLKGTGFMYIRQGVSLFPMFSGGKQEDGSRAGTENVPGIVAAAKALRMTMERAENGGLKHLQNLKRLMMDGLAAIEGIEVNTPAADSAPHIINFSVPGVKPEVLIHSLGEKDIYVSTKSACSSKLASASRILEACGYGEERAISGVRVSTGFGNTEEEVRIFLNELSQVVPKLKKVMG
ncbi:cysteine desulfurase family protein [Bacillus marinisedimentorum]|uniref:cysteine desulfurase family protein n=1 Tax=Bacillus marinisedimentorum TaxID=1821260 RepID=UPI0007DF05E3|nr:cysteine desulfurase family protein [Bacillus marinisedimentorum]